MPNLLHPIHHTHSTATIILMMVMGVGLIGSCAQQGYPSGGPKDETPPTVLTAEPPSGSTNFALKEFSLFCDEYVQMKDAESNVLISPPMKSKPKYTIVGRSIRVGLCDTLRENTSYRFLFQGAIVDYNEGNPLASYEYTLATGPQMDSMMLQGEVLDATTLLPHKETVTILAYSTDNDSWDDSIVVGQMPCYITQCDVNGHFALHHLRAGCYLLIALEDANHNMRLDADEAVAFADSSLPAYPMSQPAEASRQSAPQDSTATDSVKRDSVTSAMPTVRMLMSLDQQVRQHITDKEFVSQGHAQITTARPMAAPSIKTSSPCLFHLSRNSNTLELWTLTQATDTLRIVLTDSSGIHDRIQLTYHTVSIPNIKRGNSHKQTFASIKNMTGVKHPYWDTLWLRSDTPLRYATSDSVVTVMALEDSSITHCTILLDSVVDSNQAILRARIPFRGHEGGKYRFILPAGILTDIYGHTNDTITFSTELNRSSDYGSITLTLHGTDSMTSRRYAEPLLLQLLDNKGTLVRQYTIINDGKVSLIHLNPSRYTLRIIVDRNGDGQWTAGNYWLHRQPESILVFSKTLDLRANWEISEQWELATH